MTRVLLVACCALACLTEVRSATGSPDDTTDPLHLARQLIDQKKPADAERVLSEFLKREAGSARAHALRAEARQLLNNSKGAWSDAEKAITLDPKEPTAWEIRGLMNSSAGAWVKAEE